MRTLKELAQEALDVQNASNILGITRSYAIALVDLRAALTAEGKPSGSDDLNKHPINHMWLFKIADLSRLHLEFSHLTMAEVELLANS
jgi:hypothetical protein